MVFSSGGHMNGVNWTIESLRRAEAGSLAGVD